MSWFACTAAIVVVASGPAVAEAQCLCDEQCPEGALCRQGRCFRARAGVGAEMPPGGSIGGVGAGAGVAVDGGADGEVGAGVGAGGVGVGADVGGGGLGVDADVGGGVGAGIGGQVDGDTETEVGADVDGEDVGADVDGEDVGAGVGAGVGAEVGGDIDASAGDLSGDAALAADPTIDASAEVEPVGADYTVPIAALIGLAGAAVVTAVAALIFAEDGIDISVVPVAGPIIGFVQNIDEGFTLGTGLQLLSGVGQVTAVATVVLGLILAAPPDCPGADALACGERSFAVAPLVSDRAVGLGASAAF